jgi:hypothetical protein
MWATAGPTEGADRSVWHFDTSVTTFSVFADVETSFMPSTTVLFPQLPCPPLNHTVLSLNHYERPATWTDELPDERMNCQMNGWTARWWPRNGDLKEFDWRLKRPTRYALRQSRAMTHPGLAQRKGVTHGYLAGKLKATKGSVTVVTTMKYTTCIPRMKLRTCLQWFFRPINRPTPQINIRNNPNKCLPTKYGGHTAHFLTDVKSFNLQRLLTWTTRFIFLGCKTAQTWCWQPTTPRLKKQWSYISAPHLLLHGLFQDELHHQVYDTKTFYVLLTKCIYVVCVILTATSNYLVIHHRRF